MVAGRSTLFGMRPYAQIHCSNSKVPSGSICDSSRNRWFVRAARAGTVRSRTSAANDRRNRALRTTEPSVPEPGSPSPAALHREVQLPEDAEDRLVAAAWHPELGEDGVDAGLAVLEEEPGDREPSAVAVELALSQPFRSEDE